MAKESLNQVIERGRRPRVHIKYEVETNGAVEERELPFVMGVMGDYMGQPAEPPKALRERKFVEINRDNFNDVMAGMKPRLNVRVDEKLSGQEGKEMGVELNFKSMADFSPENVCKQIPVLHELLKKRELLKELLNTINNNQKFSDLLDEVIHSTDTLKQIRDEMGQDSAAAIEGEK